MYRLSISPLNSTADANLSVSAHTEQRLHFATPFIIIISWIRNCTAEAIFALRFSSDESIICICRSNASAPPIIWINANTFVYTHTYSTLLWKSKSAQCSSLCGGGFDAAWVASHTYSRLKEAGCCCVFLDPRPRTLLLHTRSCFAWSRVCD